MTPTQWGAFVFLLSAWAAAAIVGVYCFYELVSNAWLY